MKKISLFLIMGLVLYAGIIIAAPSAADTTAANTEFDSMDSYQSGYYAALSKYNQVAPVTKNGITYTTNTYDGPLGWGCLHRAEKTISNTTYILERHAGPETDRDIKTIWTEKVEA